MGGRGGWANWGTQLGVRLWGPFEAGGSKHLRYSFILASSSDFGSFDASAKAMSIRGSRDKSSAAVEGSGWGGGDEGFGCGRLT